jgi:prepilin signal peptidase PulO-like enzyme (type II secretory pathway)
MFMVVVVLLVLGLCLGSFVNALVWRVYEQFKRDNAKPGAHNKKPPAGRNISILQGRSMCPHCRHELAVRDLIPVLSWLSLRGKCRYCGKPIASQYPLVELITALLFMVSYLWWPEALHGAQIAVFGLWLLLLTGLMALLVYDVRWSLLPNRILYPLGFVAAAQAVVAITTAYRPFTALLNTTLAVIVGGCIFYGLFQISGGKWIGGGDVRLGWLLGLVAATPARSLLFIFLAAVGGSLVSLPLLATGRLKRTSTIPFGPFLIVGLIIVQLFGAGILHWYTHIALPASG